MRSDRDKRTDTEREIDEFLSRFETPADELSTDINTYIDEQNTATTTPTQTFSWKSVDTPAFREVYSEKPYEASSSQDDRSTIIVNENPGKETDPSKEEAVQPEQPEGPVEKPEKPAKKEKKKKAKKDPVKESEAPAAAAAAVSAPNNSKPAKKGGLGRALFLKKNKNYDPSQGPTYEKDGKTIKNKEYKFSFLKLIRDFVIIGVLCVMAGVIFALSIIASAPKYDYNDIYSQIDTSSIVYNDEGKQIDNIF